SCSQKMTCRYSSSATVTWSWAMSWSISSARMRIDATTRALVTGASRGIGRAVAGALGARGQVRDAVARFIADVGGLDLVIANAGIAHYGPFLAQDVERVEAMTRVN